MEPVTGPYVVERGVNSTGPSMAYFRQGGYRQSPPFNLPLPYSKKISSILSYDGSDPPSFNPFSNAGYVGGWNNLRVNFITLLEHGSVTTHVALVKSELFEKVVKKLDERAELLVSLAERRSTLAMMEKRLIDLHRFVKAFRHRDFGLMRRYFAGKSPNLSARAKSTLRHYARNWRLVAQNTGQAWLEFHFGWEPLVKDIDTCLQLASKTLEKQKIRVYSRQVRWVYDWSVDGANPYSRTTSFATLTARAGCACEVEIDSPKEVYKTILGLNNPGLTVYSLIPFSWMFDWVNYLGSYISQFTDLNGYSIKNASHSWKVTAEGSGSFEYPRGNTAKRNRYSGMYFARQNYVPNVTIGWRPLPERVSVARGLTAASLLVGLLGKK